MTLSRRTEAIFDWRRGMEYRSANPSLHDSSTFHQTGLGGDVRYNYAWSGNPNCELLEERLTQLEQRKFALAFTSGTAVISAMLLTFGSGDRVILPGDVYGDAFRLTEQVLNRFNTESTTVDTAKFRQIEGAIWSNTELIYIETPLDPCFKIIGIEAVSRITEEHELLVAMSDIPMTPLGQSPLLLGADIIIHSATKFLGEHNGLIAGTVITNNEAISGALYLIQNDADNMLPAQDGQTLAKHLKTFPIRFKQSIESAQKIMSFLIKQDEISEAYYPGLTTAHLEQAKSGGAVIGSCLVDKSEAQQFVDALTLPFTLVSLGGVEMILPHPATVSHATLSEEVGQERGITFGLFRLSVGLKDPDELIADIRYALKEAFNESVPHAIER